MQRRASIWYGPVIACVGHTSMHLAHVPHRSVTGASTGSGRSVRISPRKKVEPASSDSSSVCLPRQPSPALRASSTSITGAESVATR